jgi:GxxExxY protein
MPVDEALSEQIIGAAIEAHRRTGPGLLESSYQVCFCRELELRGIPFRAQVELPVVHKGVRLECGYRIDVIVAGKIVVELKAVEKILPVDEAQLITYLRLSGYRVGFLINFNVPVLKDGIVRRVV